MNIRLAVKIAFMLLICAFYKSAFSQTKYANGYVKDTNNVSIPFVNITLVSDGAIVDGTVTDFNGYYEFKNLKLPKYKILFSHLGYCNDSVIIDFSDKDTISSFINLKT